MAPRAANAMAARPALMAGLPLLMAGTAWAACSDSRWTDAYSEERCSVQGGTAWVQCLEKSGEECGMRMESTFAVGAGTHSMTIKAAPGPGVVTTFYLSDNGGLYDKTCTKPWVELDYEIMGNQAKPGSSKVWTNMFVGTCQEHWQFITLPFDVTADFHTYAFVVTPMSVSFVVDGVTYRTIDASGYPDIRGVTQARSLTEFISVWGKTAADEGEGIPEFRAALGVLDTNSNPFPLVAGFRRGGGAGPAPGPAPAPTPAPPSVTFLPPHAPAPAPIAGACGADAPPMWDECTEQRCCAGGATCFEKDATYAQCRASCKPGVHDDDKPQYQSPWTCAVLSP